MHLSCLALLGYILFLWRRNIVPFGYLPLCVLGLLTLGGFFAALTGLFNIYKTGVGAFGLLLLAVACGEMLLCRAEKRPSAAALAEPALYSACLLFLPWYFQGVRLRYYDEFFWGNLSKDLMTEGCLITAQSPLRETSLPMSQPPGPAILHNLFMPQHFDEAGMAVAGMTLVLALGCVVVQLMRPRLGLIRALLLAVSSACMARCMGTLLEGIYLIGYTEYLQAAVFAALLAVIAFEKNRGIRLTVLLPGLALLSLIKATGFLFGLGVVACAALAEWEACAPSLRAQCWRRAAGTVLLLLLPVLATKALWDWHLYTDLRLPEITGLTPSMDFHAAHVPAAAGEAPPPASPAPSPATARNLYWNAFVSLLLAFYARPLLLSPLLPESAMTVLASTLSLLLQWTAALWLLRRLTAARLPATERKMLLLLLLGLAGWMAVRYLISVYAHTPAEAMRAASFERYIGAYMAGCAVLVTLLFHRRLGASPRHHRLSHLLLGAQTLTLLILCGVLPWSRPCQVAASPVRVEMERAAALLTAHTPPHSRIWFIAQHTDNQKIWALRYLLAPDRITDLPPSTWSLGSPYDAVDRYSVPLCHDDLRRLISLHRLDYILLWHYDDVFMARYGAPLGLTSIQAPLLLRVHGWGTDGATPEPVALGKGRSPAVTPPVAHP